MAPAGRALSVAAVALVLAAGVARAQGHAEDPHAAGTDRAGGSRAAAVLGIVTDESGSLIGNARIALVADARPDLPWQRDYLAPAAEIVTSSDARGVFRIATDGPGLLLATTATGLGAVIPRCWPGRGVRLLLRPMAELVTADAGEVTLWPALPDGDGTRRLLPVQRGIAIRLPAERYEVWAATAAGFCWHRLDLRSGERSMLPTSDGVLELAPTEPVEVHPEGFPHVSLIEAGRPRCILLGAAARAPLLIRQPRSGRLRVHVPADHPGALSPVRSPARGGTLRLQVDAAPANAVAWLLVESRPADFQPVAESPIAADGALEFDLPMPSGNAWLAVTAAGHAALLLPFSSIRADQPLVLPTGRSLRCRVADSDHQPIAGVAATYCAKPDGPAAAWACSNELGTLEFALIAGAGTISIDDPRFRPARIAVDVDQQELAIVLDPGRSIEGIVQLPDGTPVAEAAIALRGPMGRMRDGERAVASDAAGRFRFQGLGDDEIVVLFASRNRDGHTWSAKVEARVGGPPVCMELRDEDPHLLPPRGR